MMPSLDAAPLVGPMSPPAATKIWPPCRRQVTGYPPGVARTRRSRRPSPTAAAPCWLTKVGSSFDRSSTPSPHACCRLPGGARPRSKAPLPDRAPGGHGSGCLGLHDVGHQLPSTGRSLAMRLLLVALAWQPGALTGIHVAFAQGGLRWVGHLRGDAGRPSISPLSRLPPRIPSEDFQRSSLCVVSGSFAIAGGLAQVCARDPLALGRRDRSARRGGSLLPPWLGLVRDRAGPRRLPFRRPAVPVVLLIALGDSIVVMGNGSGHAIARPHPIDRRGRPLRGIRRCGGDLVGLLRPHRRSGARDAPVSADPWRIGQNRLHLITRSWWRDPPFAAGQAHRPDSSPRLDGGESPAPGLSSEALDLPRRSRPFKSGVSDPVMSGLGGAAVLWSRIGRAAHCRRSLVGVFRSPCS